MKEKKKRSLSIWCADFETTAEANYRRDGEVRVWLWSLVRCGSAKEEYYGFDIHSFFMKVRDLRCKKVFFHNLAFDGKFILWGFHYENFEYGKDYTVIIDHLNQWYDITWITAADRPCQFWDSLKKFPGMSVQKLAETYGIEGKKEKPFFDVYRPKNYVPTTEEIDYCLQDSRIVAHAVDAIWREGKHAMTLSSDAFNVVKKYIGGVRYWRKTMPVLTKDEDLFVRASYKGGFVYVNPDFQDKVVKKVRVYDVNSMYPWAMTNCPLPIGHPYYFGSKRPPKWMLWIVNFRTKFQLKDGYIPTIQIKNDPNFDENEYLEGVWDEVDLTLTNIDYELFKEHYIVESEHSHEYIGFESRTGILADYIRHFTLVKVAAEKAGDKARRKMAKLMMNAPYGKTGTRQQRISLVNPSFDDDEMSFDYFQEDTDGIYCPYATFVTSYCRDRIIRAAQCNKANFIYADTDSLHLIGDAEGIEIHPHKLGAFKLEGEFEYGKYIRPKTYIHGHMPDKSYDFKKMVVDEIKCAGMPDSVKKNVSWEDFKIGAEFEGKLMKRSVKGGCYLCPTTFQIKADFLDPFLTRLF